MAKKKKKIRLDEDGFVYSTNSNFALADALGALQQDQDELNPNQQHLIAKIEKKGRGGKTVTIIEGFEGSEEDLKNLGKELKNKIGTGGSVKDGEIIMQGDVRNKVVEILQKDGYKVKKSGG
ncbi:MAG: translation initiation factor [Bacteroidota bacterium]